MEPQHPRFTEEDLTQAMGWALLGFCLGAGLSLLGKVAPQAARALRQETRKLLTAEDTLLFEQRPPQRGEDIDGQQQAQLLGRE
jgi:hypothetical protein